MVKAFNAVFDALYASSFAGEIGESFAECNVNELKIVETFTILPASDFLISGSNFWVSVTTAKKFVWKVSLRSLSLIDELFVTNKFPVSRTPALLIKISSFW